MAETIVPVISDPSLLLMVLMLLILAVPYLSARLRIPEIVGLIAAGMVVGPFGLNWIGPHSTGLVAMLGHAGLLYILFQSGLETDLHQFLRARRKSFLFGILTFAIPQAGGTFLGCWALGMGWPSAILFGSMYASHTLLTYPVVSRLGLSKYEPVTVAVGGTVVTNLVALLILAGVARHHAGETGVAFWGELLLAALSMGLLIFMFVPRLARWYFRNVPDLGGGGGSFLMVMGLMFGCAWGTHVLGLEAIIGAFAAGLALNRLIPEQSTLMSRLRFVGDTLFVPIFLLFVGMKANIWSLLGHDVNAWLADLGFVPSIRVLADGPSSALKTWIAALIMSGGVLLLKYLPAQWTARLLGYRREDANLMFGLTVVQAAGTLAAVLVGVRIGLFGSEILDGAVFMILVSCLVGAWATERFGSQIAEQRSDVSAPADEPAPRLLVPLANPNTMPLLMDMALLLRNRARNGELFPIMVAQPDAAGDASAPVARCEELLRKAVAHAAASEVPAHPLVRVDVNVVEGLLRAAAEIRATGVMLGWVRRPTKTAFFLGELFEQLVETCPTRLYVTRVVKPPQVAKRLLWLVNRHADASPDFLATARVVKRLAGQAGVAGVEVVMPAQRNKNLEERLKTLSPELPIHFHAKESTESQHRAFWSLARPDDLMAVSSARLGGLSEPSLFEVPRLIAEHFPDNTLIVAYSATHSTNEL